MKRRITSVFSLRKTVSTNDVNAGDRSGIYSCYEGGTTGECSVCQNTKQNCNCQHCRGCGSFLLALHSRHHCRMCWRPFCPRCGDKTRVVDFMGGGRPQPARVCRTCAIPQGLIHVSGMFDAFGLLRGEKAAASEEQQPADGLAEYGERFRWGLHALLSVVDAPRRCVNPSCSAELSYGEVCSKCKLPTVTCAPHQVRAVPSITTSGPNKVGSSVLVAAEDAVGREHNTAADRFAASDVDALFSAALPNQADNFALHGLREDTWAARKALLSRIAVGIAGEWQRCPNISLAMSDSREATLLRIVRIEPLYTVFSSPGMVRYVAFAPANGRKALDRRLANTVHNRQVWTTTNSQLMGIIAADERGAKARGGMELVGEFGAKESLLRELESNPVYTDITNDMLALMRDGADVVFCGFSTGGSIASLLTARLLIEHTDITSERLMCVTFGAPLVANRGLTELLETSPRGNLCRKFQHFVHGSDVMPRMSFLGTFLSAGTLGTAGGEGDDLWEDGTNMVEVHDLILTWLSLYQQPIPPPPSGSGGAVAKSSRRKEKRLLAKERKTPVSMQEMTSETGIGTVSNTYYERASMSNSDSDDENRVKDGGLPAAALGDIFAHTREPFDNNRDSMRTTVTTSGEVTSPLICQADTSAFATDDYRNQQVLDPFGCYNILWRGQDMYCYSDDPSKTLALLSDRSSMRVLLQDHLLSSYDRAIVEYLNAAA